MRKSEILDIKWEDIDLKRNFIRVRGSAVFDEHGKLVHKETNKNESSARDIPIFIPRLSGLVKEAERKGEYIHQGDPNKIYRHVVRACTAAGVTQCSLHDLRRTFASLCYHLDIKVMTCQRLGGWKDLETLQAVYTKLAQRDYNDDVEKLAAFYKNTNY